MAWAPRGCLHALGLSPLWGLLRTCLLPTAYAVGCILSPPFDSAQGRLSRLKTCGFPMRAKAKSQKLRALLILLAGAFLHHLAHFAAEFRAIHHSLLGNRNQVALGVVQIQTGGKPEEDETHHEGHH